MQSPPPEKKSKFSRLNIEIAVMAALFLGLIIGVQALQGESSRPKYDPLAIMIGAARAFQRLRGE